MPSKVAFVKSISLFPVSPACREPTMVIAPTQNNRLAVTKPSAIVTFSPGFLKRFSSFSAKLLRCLSRSNASPMTAPTAMDIMAMSVFSPDMAPSIPMYITHRAIPFIMKSDQPSGMSFLASRPITLPATTVSVLTITPTIIQRHLSCPHR